MLEQPTNRRMCSFREKQWYVSPADLWFYSSVPALTIRSMASRKSCFCIAFLFLRAAIRAASLHTLAISTRKTRCLFCQKFQFKTGFWTFIRGNVPFLNISRRSFKLRANPRESAGQKRPAATRPYPDTLPVGSSEIMTPLLVPKPSISVSSWFLVCFHAHHWK